MPESVYGRILQPWTPACLYARASWAYRPGSPRLTGVVAYALTVCRCVPSRAWRLVFQPAQQVPEGDIDRGQDPQGQAAFIELAPDRRRRIDLPTEQTDPDGVGGFGVRHYRLGHVRPAVNPRLGGDAQGTAAVGLVFGILSTHSVQEPLDSRNGDGFPDLQKDQTASGGVIAHGRDKTGHLEKRSSVHTLARIPVHA